MEALLMGPIGPLLVFSARLIDVPLATVRTILMARGTRGWVPLIAFFESLSWLLVVSSVISVLDTSPWMVLAYALGFAAGNHVGMIVEGKLGMGLLSTFILTRSGIEVADALRDQGFGATEFLGQGREGRMEMVISVVRRKRLTELEGVAHTWDPEAVIVVGETRALRNGVLQRRR
ncbi:MAG: DUF5698 domain-containing protein [Longimicrobiales bacterium]|nr:DUF5698 domain-containing protein [Longimicrobiales bacterium]